MLCVQEESGDNCPADDEEDEDDEGESAGSNEEFEAGEGVEEMLRLLEEGGALPDIEGLMDAEDPEVILEDPTLCMEVAALPCPARPCPAPPCPALPMSGHHGSVLRQCPC